MLFGGISGSAVADVSALGSILIPVMKEKGYRDDYAVNVTVTSSIAGIMIPPSHNMILYAVAAGGGISISQLFLAGVVPGIIMCFLPGRSRLSGSDSPRLRGRAISWLEGFGDLHGYSLAWIDDGGDHCRWCIERIVYRYRIRCLRRSVRRCDFGHCLSWTGLGEFQTGLLPAQYARRPW